MSVIILDGHLKSALAATRSLGRHGVEVVCGAERKSALAMHSRYAKESFAYASPKKHPLQFVEDLTTQAKKLSSKTGSKPVIFCFSDATLLEVSNAAGVLQQCAVVLLPKKESLEIASDKVRTYEFAAALSIPVIRTYKEDSFDKLKYPAVVKNRHSIVRKDGIAVSGSASFVFSREELVTRYASILNATGEAPLVMEFVQGAEYGIEMVCEHGEVLAQFAHVRIRSLSPRGGAAVVKETAPDSGAVQMMRTYAQALARKLVWEGPMMVEFKMDAQTGAVYLMEINGRFWGSLPLAVEAGVDFPRIAYELARGEAKGQSASSVSFVRTRHFLGDCRWLFSVLFVRDPLRRFLYPSRFRALKDFFREFLLSRGDIFTWDDPAPALFEYIDILNKWRSKA
jgi:predicted ATP-grasp superfamily ATP-dependent carboligase